MKYKKAVQGKLFVQLKCMLQKMTRTACNTKITTANSALI